MTGLAAASILMASSVAFAAHPSVPGFAGTLALKDANGNAVSANTPYSPKKTCAAAGCHDYGSGFKQAHKTQGVLNGNQVHWQSYTVDSYAHGTSVGRHSNQGRNEDYSTTMRTSFGDPFFTSSPGMFGKY